MCSGIRNGRFASRSRNIWRRLLTRERIGRRLLQAANGWRNEWKKRSIRFSATRAGGLVKRVKLVRCNNRFASKSEEPFDKLRVNGQGTAVRAEALEV